MKKKYYLVFDIETANSTDEPLVYDVGCAICDKNGIIYDSLSLVISDIFDGEKELMSNAYYAAKLPLYYNGLANGSFIKKNFYNARVEILALIKKYGVKEVFAFNADFDSKGLNFTQRWLTKSKYRWFFPYGLVKVHCIWHMACQVICTQKSYRLWCIKNGFFSKVGNILTDASTVYRYISGQTDFEEQHTGREDVEIEVAILAQCFRQKKAMDRSINRRCWMIPQIAR